MTHITSSIYYKLNHTNILHSNIFIFSTYGVYLHYTNITNYNIVIIHLYIYESPIDNLFFRATNFFK